MSNCPASHEHCYTEDITLMVPYKYANVNMTELNTLQNPRSKCPITILCHNECTSANVLSYTVVHLHKHLKFAPTSHKKGLKRPLLSQILTLWHTAPLESQEMLIKMFYFSAGSDSKIQHQCRETLKVGSCAT